ncbi:MAG: hypothetical protein QM704_03660 [Anaeromyxobacteraceae bacterium]
MSLESRTHGVASHVTLTDATTGAVASGQHTFPSGVEAQYLPAPQLALVVQLALSFTEPHAAAPAITARRRRRRMVVVAPRTQT